MGTTWKLGCPNTSISQFLVDISSLNITPSLYHITIHISIALYWSATYSHITTPPSPTAMFQQSFLTTLPSLISIKPMPPHQHQHQHRSPCKPYIHYSFTTNAQHINIIVSVMPFFVRTHPLPSTSPRDRENTKTATGRGLASHRPIATETTVWPSVVIRVRVRHGPAVCAICRNVVHKHHGADKRPPPPALADALGNARPDTLLFYFICFRRSRVRVGVDRGEYCLTARLGKVLARTCDHPHPPKCVQHNILAEAR